MSIYGLLQKGTIVYLLILPATVWLFIRRQSVMHTFLLGIALLELYQLAGTLIWGGAWVYARHMITTQTFLFFLIFWWILQCIRMGRRRKMV